MKKIVFPCLAVLLLASCYPTSPTYVQTYDMVITNYNPDFNFSSKQTFAIPDSVIVVTGDKVDNPNAPLQYVSSAYAALIVNAISSNLTSLGWTRVNKSQNPDVMLFPAAMQTTYLYYYYDYWYYWDWWYGGYYGWYYPGYYPPVVSSYTTGTLLVTMVDQNALTPDQELPVEWTMVINGLLTGDITSASSRISSSIDQAFKQSQYLAQ